MKLEKTYKTNKRYRVKFTHDDVVFYLAEDNLLTSQEQKAQVFAKKHEAMSARNRQWYKIPRERRKHFRIYVQPVPVYNSQTGQYQPDTEL